MPRMQNVIRNAIMIHSPRLAAHTQRQRGNLQCATICDLICDYLQEFRDIVFDRNLQAENASICELANARKLIAGFWLLIWIGGRCRLIPRG